MAAAAEVSAGAALGGVGGGVDIARRAGSDAAGAAETNPAGTGNPGAGTGAEGTVNARRVTTIQRPYRGTVPVQTQKSAAPVTVDRGSVQRAANIIEGAQNLANAPTGKSFKSALRDAYRSVFQSARGVPVDGLTFEGQPYTVDIPNSVPGKVISDPNLTADKLALLDILPQIIQNGEYVGSGAYVPHGSKSKNTVRYDYFETPVEINGNPYIVSFDVEVFPNVNNYRTYRLNEIELSPAVNASTGRDPAADIQRTAPVEGTRPLNSDSTIAPGAENVNATAPFSRS